MLTRGARQAFFDRADHARPPITDHARIVGFFCCHGHGIDLHGNALTGLADVVIRLAFRRLSEVGDRGVRMRVPPTVRNTRGGLAE